MLCACICPPADAQQAVLLKNVKSVYVGSLGSREGAEDLRRELSNVLRHTHRLRIVPSPDQADVVLMGRGELWIRGYHSLSPRARANAASAEPIYNGFLSIKAQGKGGEILWSYLVSPKRVSFDNLKHDLASRLVSKLLEDIDNSIDIAAAPASFGGAAATLRGAGATFPFPIYQDWFGSFHAKHPSWQFEYKPVGSEAGVAQLVSGNADFAGFDIPPGVLAKMQRTRSLKGFPSIGGAVVLIYNLPSFGGELRLTAQALAGILTGKISTWNDPALQQLNRGVSLPAAPITVVHRSDGSGTTFALTDYLAKASASWKQTIGSGARIPWPTGQGAPGNDGVAKAVAATPYSLGYVEFIYAFDRRLSFASIRNAAGRFIQADLPSITEAANSAGGEMDGNFDLSIANAPGADAYPISTFSWLVFSGQMQSEKRGVLLSFLEWMLTSGQKQCSALGYAPLPKTLLDRELTALRKLKR